jgi:sensor domain CHASE-containing protein
MKRLLTLLAMTVFITTARSQNITSAEYFIDTDPGRGNGVPITVPAPGAIVNFTANVSTTSLSAGFHFVAIRAKDANGVWGLFETRGFYISSSTTNAADITAAEYFFDVDPGSGNGTAASVGTTGAVVNFTAVIPTALSAGFHFLAIRTKDANGVWGLFETRGFYISSSTADAANIVAAEYFFDTDPGRGNGTAVSVGTTGAVVNFTAVIPTSLSAGFHFLAIRTKDANGIWGLFETRGFYTSSSTADAANIVAAEYFFDTDPAPGNGTTTSVGAAGSVVNFTAVIPTSLPAGFHFLAIRVKGQDGIWGLFEKRGFYISNSTADAANIVAAEYFFDTDPGPGNGTATSVGTTGSVVNFTAVIPTSLSAGFHFLSIRVKGADGVWGLFEKRGFYISTATADMPIITAAEYFFDADPGIGNGTSLTITTPGNIVTQTFVIPAGALPLGQHFLSIRVKDQSGNWSLYEYDTVNVGNSTITCTANTSVNAGAGQCNAVVNSIDPIISPVQAFTYTLTGATTGSGSGTASGQTFNAGVTTVQYVLTGSPTVNCSFTVTVNASVVPSVSIVASATNICTGTNVTFTATPANGGVTPFYQWRVNSVNVGTNSTTYQNAGLANSDVVSVVMTSSIPCASPASIQSNPITMIVSSTATPSVSIAASATTICSGTNVIFTATPVNGGTPSFQWKLNGANVGVNSSSYQNSTLANNDVVTVVMTSSLACVTQPTATSNAITITVNPNVVPSVSVAASATTICSGTNVIFTATPTNGGATPSYQWKLDGGNVGTNSATYQNATLANNDVITVVMTSSLPCAVPVTATSATITMTVTTTVTPSLSIAASATTICSGTNVIFTATPTNGGTPSYQWKLNGGNVGTNSATYQNAALANNDVVTVVMTSSLTCVTSTTATSNAITITVSGTVAPSVSISASATTICSGTNVIFTATPVNGGTPSYQWKLNGTNVGTNSPTYQNATLANNDVVTVVMTSSLACAVPNTATSNAITMTVTSQLTPSVSIAATATTICAGTNVTFTATPTNGGAPSYQCKLNGINVGTNSATYQNATLVNNDVVTVVMTSSLTCVTSPTATSNAITMTVTSPVTPAVSIAASATTICAGTNVTFTATPVNGGTPSYQWKLNGTNVGTNSATYQNAALANNDVVTVVMTSSATCVSPATATSNAITITVTSPVTPSVSITASATTICAGTNVTFTATPTNGGTPSYQWKLNGTNVGTNSASYQNTALANNDVVTVVMTSSLTCVTQSTATSNAITITVAAAQTWIGVTSTDWNTASNWCGGIPTSTTDVIIPSVAPNMPNLNGGTGTARNITINTGGSVTLTATGILDLFGSVTNNGTFNTTAGSINFRGTVSQSMPAFTVNNATMNGSGGVVLAGNATVNGTLALTNGNITLGTNNLSLAASSTGSVASHIITNGTGNVVVKALAASNIRTVPVAVNATSYNPVVIAANTGHTTDDITVRVLQGVFINGSSGNQFTDIVVDKTWIINETVAGGSNVNVTLQWTALQELPRFTRSKCYVTQNINGTWQSAAPTAATGTDPFTQTKNNVTAFSPFAVQTQTIPRPSTGIYPNPVATILNIVTDLPFTEQLVISVYDATGRLVLQQSASAGSGLSQASINVEKLSGGVYMLKIASSRSPQLLLTKFVKQ